MQTDHDTPKLSRRSQELLDRLLKTGRYGRLAVLGFHGKDQRRKMLVDCKCDCGNAVTVRARFLLNGTTESCGCYRKDRNRELKSIHGARHTAEYSVWCGLNGRCHNEHDISHKRYGGRGIVVCPEWRNRKTGFITFLKDMGLRPSPDHSIERKDNDGPYARWNCVWATQVEQQRNKSTNHLLRFGDEVKCVAAWEEQLGFEPGTLKRRIQRGWDVDRALTTPSGSPRKSTRWLTFNGESHSVSDWERLLGWKPTTISQRLKCNWTVEEALTLPLGAKPERLTEWRSERARLAGQARMRQMTKRQRSQFGKNAVRAREEKKSQFALRSA